MQQNIGNIFNLVHKNCHKILHMLLFNNIYGIDWHFLKRLLTIYVKLWINLVRHIKIFLDDLNVSWFELNQLRINLIRWQISWTGSRETIDPPCKGLII